MPAALVQLGTKPDAATGRTAQTEIRDSAANEFVFAVVGHVGSGTSEVAKLLETILERRDLVGGPFDAEILKARDHLKELDGAAAVLAGSERTRWTTPSSCRTWGIRCGRVGITRRWLAR